jgi:hypothetical protein
MTTANATILTAAIAFITAAGVSLNAGNWIPAAVEFAIGIIGIVVYEKMPSSTTAQ